MPDLGEKMSMMDFARAVATRTKVKVEDAAWTSHTIQIHRDESK